ncbi:hypothetical protein HPP92_007130 [Vanilla planifolia]|uniref:Phospholipid/glycerol acyltransferase domain-containing protein n=1 Tax=Vanilla planifolia TaxID=51239 RepID=A0A835V9C4_VANPL|nr:hypothetical protein HPP92_007130 [Vanilla planifolia]
METFPRLKVAFPIPLLRLGWNKSCHTILRRDFNFFSGDQLVSRIRGMCFIPLLLLLLLFPVVVMLLVHPVLMILDRHRRRIHHFIAKIWATLTIYPFYRFEFEGLHNLPPHDSPAVYVSNHQSFLDIYTLLTLGRSFKFISKTGVFIFQSLVGDVPYGHHSSSANGQQKSAGMP